MIYVVNLCSVLFGLWLAMMGHSPWSWQWWTAVILYVIPVGFLFYERSKNPR